MESEIMDLKTEMIKNRKAMEEFRSISDSNSFNNKVAEFRQEVDMLFKSAKNDFAGNEFNNRLLELQKELDDLKNSNNDNKYTKDSKKVKIKQMENLEQVTVEVQRLSDGLNNLFNFTQA
jgi:valyl-tRNA synthetase